MTKAPQDRLPRVRRERTRRRQVDQPEEIAEHCVAMPVLDERRADEILGY